MNSEGIAADLRRRIRAGTLPVDVRPPDALIPGMALPTIRSLAESLDVSPETVHKAYRQLADGGLIHTRQGRSATVADHRPLWVITGHTYDRARREDPSGLTIFEQQTAAAGRSGRTDHHFAQDQPLPRWAADLLGADEGEPALLLSGEGFACPIGAEGEPVQSREYVAGIYDCYVPNHVVSFVPQLITVRDDSVKDRWIGGVWSVIERGLADDLVRQRWRISGAMSTEEESDRFGLSRSAPVLVEENCHMNADGRVLVATRMLKLFGSVLWDLELEVQI